MSWFKLAAIAGGIIIAFLVVGGIIGAVVHLLGELLIAALVVGAIVVAIKVARSGKQISRKRTEREVRDRDDDGYRRPLPRSDVEPASTGAAGASYQPPPRPSAQDVDDDLAKLKRELGL
jgi:hypothetical protein